MAEAVSGLTGSLQGSVQGFVNQGQSILDRFIPPETRNKITAWISKFAAEKPGLASFIASHIALSGLPLGIFVVMTISIGIFALIVALILALLATVAFIVFAAGFALIWLLPTLFVTTAIATFIWLWGVGTYYLLKHFNEKPIPGINTDLGEGLKDDANQYADKGVMQGFGLLEDTTEEKEAQKEGQEKGEQQRKEAESNAVNGAKKKDGHQPRKLPDRQQHHQQQQQEQKGLTSALD